MTIQAWSAITIFTGTIFLIASGKLKTAAASLLGACLMIILGLIDSSQAVAAIDHNTIGLLVGMMIVVSILSKSGLFQFLAVKAIKLTKGNAILIFWIISVLTAALSAFLDNVTTVLLVTPVVLSLCDLISMNPMPLLLMELFASNIGGTATLIGDPPNMIIASVAKFTFNDFIFVTSPVASIILVAVTAYMARHFRETIKSDPVASERLKQVDEYKLIINKPLMVKSVVVIAAVLLGFVLHSAIHLEPSVVALTAAGVLLAISFIEEKTIIHEDIEWPTLIYFICLFIMAGGLKETGAIDQIAIHLTSLMAGSELLMIMGILWISGITCMFVNNIAFSAIFAQVIGTMASAAGISPAPLYWALALGACLGGNGTYFGAAANAVAADFAAREGMPISFTYFFKVGLRVVLISLLLASACMLIIAREDIF